MDDSELMTRFRDSSISREDWTHLAHIRVAWLHLRQFTLQESMTRLRAGIKALNQAIGVENGPESGYHETMTWAWLHVVRANIRNGVPLRDSLDFCEQNPHLRRTLLRLFYTRDLIMSAEARRSIVQPDIGPLPAAD